MHPPASAVREAVARALAEDLGPLGDLTSALLPSQAKATADVVPRKVGVLAGRLAATEAFAQVDAQLHVDWWADDGHRVSARQPIATVTGSLTSILVAERTALNFLSHLSGIATLTRRYADAAAPGAHVRDTRKTTPGLRALEKYAVRCGGGMNHRFGLDDAILIKDNHIAVAGPPSLCVRKARDRVGSAIKVECEVGNMGQAVEAIEAGADIVMLDNFTPSRAAKAIKELSSIGLRKKCRIEISGGVNERNIGQFAKSKPDFISLGYITHSPRAVDFSLEMKPA